MDSKFDKILDHTLKHSSLSPNRMPGDEIHICGHSIGDIFDSSALQDKLYNILYPATVSIASIRTIGPEDIRSRK